MTTNREWLFNKMQNMSDEELGRIIRDCGVCQLAEVEGVCGINHCAFELSQWLKQEHKEKITLSEAERIILENIDKNYKYIARDRIGTLCVFKDEPKKDEDDMWVSKIITLNCSTIIEVFNHLFQFITWNDSEPYNIEELLKGE